MSGKQLEIERMAVKRLKGRRKINNKDKSKQMPTSITVTYFQTKYV